MNKKITIVILSIVAVLLLASCSYGYLGKGGYVPTLSVIGSGKVILVPDLARISIGVRTEAVEVSTALSANSSQAAKISKVLVDKGVDEKDIQTSSFNVYPMQQYDNEGKVIKTTYVVENTVNVTVRDLKVLGELLDATVKAGANNIYGISFDVNDETKQDALSQARDMAIKDAKEKANAIAKASGVKLGRIQNITVSNLGGTTAVYDSKMGIGGAAAEVPVSAGTLVITFEANLTYAIR